MAQGSTAPQTNVILYSTHAAVLTQAYIFLILPLLLEALSHGAIFLATCNAMLFLGDGILANTCSITVC